ncbi:glutathione S-transferase N-terminal domain-containing protein [Marinomonas shanghaiensis]|uniref:glutathione S-transferase N-terminal domain-containing protein n=1 Tax=Marinomonas shanghaiensis TaxID=2202418 RepID=UPI003A90B1B2
MQLVVGTLSTWSLRARICGALANIPLDLVPIDLSKMGHTTEVRKYSPTGLVPALLVDGFIVHDSLAIAEYFNECSNGALYPKAQSERAQARSLCMEMHSGFMALRSQCPFTLASVAPLEHFTDSLKKEVERIEVIFTQAKGPFMFEQAGAVDAFFSILAFRLNAYGVVLGGKAGEYQRSLLEWPLLKNAVSEARQWAV